MVFWPAVALIGFLVLISFVIAMGTQSTARYEQERQSETAGAATEHTGALPA